MLNSHCMFAHRYQAICFCRLNSFSISVFLSAGRFIRTHRIFLAFFSLILHRLIKSFDANKNRLNRIYFQSKRRKVVISVVSFVSWVTKKNTSDKCDASNWTKKGKTHFLWITERYRIVEHGRCCFPRVSKLLFLDFTCRQSARCFVWFLCWCWRCCISVWMNGWVQFTMETTIILWLLSSYPRVVHAHANTSLTHTHTHSQAHANVWETHAHKIGCTNSKNEWEIFNFRGAKSNFHMWMQTNLGVNCTSQIK